MSDVFANHQRSSIMKAVKSSGNKSTELKLITLFKKHRITGWRRNYKLVGAPDFVFPKSRIVVFADGCFWHGHPCRNIKPKDNSKYWRNKIQRNKSRDSLVNRLLRRKKWIIFRIWECQIKKSHLPKKIKQLFNKKKEGRPWR